MEYLALLGNVDRSILKVDFGSGFKVESIELSDFIKLCNESFVFSDVENKVEHPWSSIPSYPERPSKKVYVIKKHLSDYPIYNGCWGDLDNRIENLPKENEFEYSISSYINHKLNLLRVLSHGDIKVAFEVFYNYVDGQIDTMSAYECDKTSRNQMFSLFHSDYDLVNQFLAEYSLESLPKYIKFALSNYEKSYFTNHYEFDFLALMIALEAVFNDAKSELTLRVSRGCAVLLGDNEVDAEKLFKQVKQFYSKRSKLVHTGDIGLITKSDVHELRFIVGRVLFKVMKLKLPKHELSTKLIMKGFGDSW
ncbi:HEPN domain-containing protein [Aliivibrio fischeri]|uniref:HEPN domain-containing protein n=1 Tax=Aliivibrio fischeri TaxID=668 RepID=UPI00107EDE13|nr:HEPN domain-containing protein [Aliivibrio fischeri]MCE7556452.1 hypothetical protein [Aliivibrio fischeri]MCE7562983.1 hypothetical protein [Aliivibrio fischeri]MCE7571275.1 hypothetical protein [Aliivibrio fischeri]TGA68220.1 hypothetical protein VFES401_15130 [Aliivibrio fischeri]